jgi:hypothetical protein
MACGASNAFNVVSVNQNIAMSVNPKPSTLHIGQSVVDALDVVTAGYADTMLDDVFNSAPFNQNIFCATLDLDP